MDAVKRFGLGSSAEEREFHEQSPGYLFFACSLQAMAPAVGPEKRPAESAFSAWTCSAADGAEYGDNGRILRQWTRVSPFAGLSFAVYGFLASGPSVGALAVSGFSRAPGSAGFDE